MPSGQVKYPIFDKLPFEEVRAAFAAYQEALESMSDWDLEEAAEELSALRGLILKRFRKAFEQSLGMSHRVQLIDELLMSSIEYCVHKGVRYNILLRRENDPLFGSIYLKRDMGRRGVRSYVMYQSMGPIKDFEIITGQKSDFGDGLLSGDPVDSPEEAALILLWMLVRNKEYLMGIGSYHTQMVIQSENKLGRVKKDATKN